ncbi:MAG: WecB/TagA/CpsF family glycosyltransferase, partial [Terracidiphilus sp.]
PTPPRWAGKMGLEWLFRLIAEPGRLWRRYLVEPWVLAFLILLNLDRQNRFGRRHTPPPDAESSNEEKLIVSPPPIRNTAGGDPKRAR